MVFITVSFVLIYYSMADRELPKTNCQSESV